MIPPFEIPETCRTDGDIVEAQKHDCRNRNACLNTAIARRQIAFACVQEDNSPCPSYARMTPREIAEDVEPLLHLAGTIIRPGRHQNH